jgi:F-type H+-transporting ATPase subunit alpha
MIIQVEDQVAIIYAGSKNENVPVNKVKEFEKDFLEFLNNKHRATLDALKAGKLTDEMDVIKLQKKFQQNNISRHRKW